MNKPIDTTNVDRPVDGLILVGDVLTKIKEVQESTVQLVVTSPPYF